MCPGDVRTDHAKNLEEDPLFEIIPFPIAEDHAPVE